MTEIPEFPPGTKREDAIDELISDGDLKEVVLKQSEFELINCTCIFYNIVD